MLESAVPVGSNPTNVAPLTSAFWPRMKSSAVSVSSAPPPAGRDSVAILPSVLPVLNSVIGPAAAVVTREIATLAFAMESISQPCILILVSSGLGNKAITSNLQKQSRNAPQRGHYR